jgi:membrane protein required for colicin V production
MPSYLDLIVLAVIVVSALLAMLRGFTREVMAILSWGAAAAAAIYFYPLLIPKLADAGSPIFVAKEALRPYIAGAGIFFVTLILVSIVTIRISDAILDSKIGALDRSLGFLFGLARGLVLCAIAFVFLNWLAPDAVSGADKTGAKKDWLANSKTLPLLKTASAQLLALLPDDPDGLISKIKKAKPGADEAPPQESDGEPKDAPATPSPVKPEPKAKSDAGVDKGGLDAKIRGR